MADTISLIGRKFDRLTVTAFSHFGQRTSSFWIVTCNCSTVKTVVRSNLVSGSVMSCGCLARDLSRTRATTHGCTGSRLFRIWSGMRRRCRDVEQFPTYAGRGIAVCAEWETSFSVFAAWANSHGYADDLEIDRIDNDRNYEPDNCRWVTPVIQGRNTPTCKLTQELADEIRIYSHLPRKILAQKYGVTTATISRVINRKIWS